MKKIRPILAAIILAIAMIVPVALTSSPAHAADRWIYHHSPDEGYDPPIKMRCGNHSIFYVYEGESSQTSGPACATGPGVAVWVRGGEQIVCRTWYGWAVKWDADNFWYALSAGQTENCVMQVD